MQNKLFVGNLAFSTTEGDIQEHFSRIAPVTSVHLVLDRATSQSRGIAFVEYATPEEAQQAIRELDGKPLDGRPLRVAEARPREERPAGGGGGYRGAGGGGGYRGGGGGGGGDWKRGGGGGGGGGGGRGGHRGERRDRSERY